jgi:hypothetical protein
MNINVNTASQYKHNFKKMSFTKVHLVYYAELSMSIKSFSIVDDSLTRVL